MNAAFFHSTGEVLKGNVCGIVQNITCQPSIRCAPALIQHHVWVTSNCGPPGVRKQGLNGWVGPQCLAVWFVQTQLPHVLLYLNSGSHVSVLLCSTWQTSVSLKTFKRNRNSPVLDFWHLLSCFLLSLSVSSSNFYERHFAASRQKGVAIVLLKRKQFSCDAQFQEWLVMPFKEIGRGGGEQY